MATAMPQPEPVLRRHADHDPSMVCRPALGYGLCEVLERVCGLDEQPGGDVTELVRVDPAAAVEEPLF